MKNFKITEAVVNEILKGLGEVPTKFGRGLQDYLVRNIVEIKEEPKEAQVEPNLEEKPND